MAGKVKGITIEFRGETTKLDKAIKDVNKETAKLDAELKQVNNALRFNPKNTELMAQKQQILTQKVSATEDKLKALRAAEEKMANDKNIDKNSAEWRDLQREIITTESKLTHFQMELKKVNMQSKRLYRLGAAFKDVGGKIEAAGQKLRGLSTAAGLVVAGLGAITYKAGKTADELNTLSKVTGISTGDLQMYAATADLVDVSVEDMAKAHQRLKKSMASDSSAEYFKQLGVETRNADGSLRDVNDVFDETIVALGKMENETERDAISMALMGKSATNLNPLIEDGGKTYEKVSKMMKKYGLSPVSQEDLDRANEFNDAIDTIKFIFLQTVQIVGTKIAGYLVPMIEKVVQKVAEFAKKFSGVSGETLAKIGAIMTAVALLSPALVLLGKVISAVGTAMQTAVKIAGGLSKAFSFMAANPIVLVIAGITALIAIFVLLWNKSEKFRQFFLNMWDNIKEKVTAFKTGFKEAKDAVVSEINALKDKATELKDKFIDAKDKIVNGFKSIPDKFKDVWDRIGDGLKNLGSKVGTAVLNAIKGGINGVISTVENVINKAIDKINAAITWANKVIPGSKHDIGSVSHVSLPRLARGGIVDSATLALIGEGRSSEAVIPLDELWKRMDKMTQAVAGVGGEGITINVYGANGQSVTDLAREVERAIISAQKRRTQAWA